jgi:glycosyltransferase involved in cell wall biosynthesis
MQIVLHGFSGVAEKRYRSPLLRYQDMRTALMLFNIKSVQYIVLEQSIRDTVVRILPFLAPRIDVLEHPISPNEVATETVDLTEEPTRFGFLGLADWSKGFPTFVELANRVVANYGRRAEFHAIGRLPETGSASPKGTEVLATRPGCIRLMRDEFIRSIMPLHFIVLPHQPASYRLTASGVLLDAMAWGKPVIARKIPIFEAMFQRHGDIGYLFSDDSELKIIVEQILQTPDKSRYRNQVLNLRSARKSRSPETLAETYRQICMNSQ